MKYKLNSKSETNFGAHVVEGTTLTIPGLAPSLIELLEANLAGEGLPMVGKPLFDDSEEAGSARLAASQATMAELNAFAMQQEAEAAAAEALAKKAEAEAAAAAQTES